MHRYAARGHTLLELLIALTLSIVVIATMLQVYQRVWRHQQQLVDGARMRMTGLLALDAMKAYLYLSGYGIHLKRARELAYSPPAIVGCAGGGRRHISCPDVAGGSEALLIHYRADRVSAWRGGDGQPQDCSGTGLDLEMGASGSSIQAYFDVRFNGKSGQRQLYCSSLKRAGAAIVGDIEHLQARYWLPGFAEPVAAQRLSPADWHAVRGVSFCVIVRGGLPGLAKRYRDCDGNVQPADVDGHQRRAFSATAAARNYTASDKVPYAD